MNFGFVGEKFLPGHRVNYVQNLGIEEEIDGVFF
jgi:hypothetical protein